MSDPYQGESPETGVPGLVGTNKASGDGVWGQSEAGRGVVGVAKGSGGVGVWGVATGGRGVVGVVDRADEDAVGSVDESSGAGDFLEHDDGIGVIGTSIDGPGLSHIDFGGDVVGGIDEPTVGAAVDILSQTARGDDVGVWGETKFGRGVVGVVTHPGGSGVWGATTDGRAIVGVDEGVGNGVWGETKRGRAVVGVAGGPGTAIYGEKQGEGGFAGFFVGNVHITGSVSCATDIALTNADCAEDFDVDVEGDPDVEGEPGTVMVVGRQGALRPCSAPYDRRVAGVVSGAGDFRPALVLDRARRMAGRRPIALVGKVWCKVDATRDPVAVGDLLTSSARSGHAMKACDPARAFGAVIGKALGDLRGGVGLVPILVALQ